MDGAQWFNALEACLWLALGSLLLIRANRRHPRRSLLRFGAIVLLLFGASDLVEVCTGAWWRPWWLLAWKGGCLVALLLLWRKWRSATTPG